MISTICGSAMPPTCVPNASPPSRMMRFTRFSCIYPSRFDPIPSFPLHPGEIPASRRRSIIVDFVQHRDNGSAARNRPSTGQARTDRRIGRHSARRKPVRRPHRETGPRRSVRRISAVRGGPCTNRMLPMPPSGIVLNSCFVQVAHRAFGFDSGSGEAVFLINAQLVFPQRPQRAQVSRADDASDIHKFLTQRVCVI